MSLPPAIQRVRFLVTAVVTIARDEQLTFLAAAIAYYAFVSLFPLALLVAAVATALGGEALATDVVGMASETLTPASQEVLRDALVGSDGRSGATIVGLVVLVWSALKVFRAIDRSFSAVYGQGLEEPLAEQLVEAAIGLAAVTLAGTVAVGVTVAVNLVDLPYGNLVGAVVTVVTLGLVFFPLYYLFPHADVSVEEALPGSVFAAVSWAVLSLVFSVYTTEYATAYAVYGVVGGILLLVTWLYLGALVLLVGASLNAVLAGRSLATDDLDASLDRHLQTAGLRQDEATRNSDDA
ncbi:YihY/virulence factor BrkB family protein [Haloarchaeobius iranensis]|uniref:YihY family inner membrane protein n=1 Tax=Haloarchaeobius iranensis TaxID=996166 RepID=A0A1G9VDQ4_9EURY|nr:YihY/virulence factor BrkB family protein [Haloarchaeobius iranensis]SDM69995.1 YihY family inner membrane protein [Haloarchaeobius iranensis]